MEDGWERPPRLSLCREDVANVVAAAFPTRALCRYVVLETGLANTNLRFWVDGDASSYVLRLHTRDRTAARRERDVMRLLQENAASIPVAELVYSDVEGDTFETPVSIWRFVEGDLLQTLLPTLNSEDAVQAAAACGEVLARFTAFPFERSGEFGPNLSLQTEFGAPSRFVPQAIQSALFRGRAGARLGENLRDALWATVQRVSPELTQIDGRYCLVHADYKRSNLLLRRTGNGFEVAAVLDWEFACAGTPLIDVGIFLRAGERLPSGFRDAFVAAYRDGGGWVPKEWLRLSRLVDLISQVTFLDSEMERPRVFAESIAVIEETLRALA